MLNTFSRHITHNFNFLKESKLLIAISGGLDSVVLTYLCYKLELNIALAHCNFNLRGKESNEDEAFILKLAKKLNSKVFIKRFDTENYAKVNKLSIQIAARKLRYSWFKELSEQLQINYILTAHHADDNLETFLINLSRGTGLEGLTGIPKINDAIVRPLLSFSRESIENYAHREKLKWREDSSNISTKYLRNKFRHEVIPVLKEINPQLLQNFQNTIDNLQDSKDIIKDKITDLIKEGTIKLTAKGFQLSVSKIKNYNNPKAYLYRFLNEYGFAQWDDIVNLLDAQSGKQVFSSTHRLIKNRELLLLSEINQDEFKIISIPEKAKEIKAPFGILIFDEDHCILENKKNVILVDKSKLKFPLILRKWEQGDYFYPKGMSGKKKLSKYFKDEKLSLLDKEQVWLLCSKNDVIWVINRRADNRFIVTENTKNTLKIEFQ